MRGGVVLIVVALLLAWVAVTGRYKCLSAALDCLVSGESDCGCGGSSDSDLPGSGDVRKEPTFAPRIEPLKPLRPLGGILA